MASSIVFVHQIALMNGSNVFFNRRCSSARESVLSLWEGMSHEDCQPWKCSFTFQQMQLSLIVLLPKMSHCSFSSLFAHTPSGGLCHLSQSSAQASCLQSSFQSAEWKKGVRKGSFSIIISSYMELPNPSMDCLHTYIDATFEHIKYKKIDHLLLWVSISEGKAFKIRWEDCRNINNTEIENLNHGLSNLNVS